MHKTPAPAKRVSQSLEWNEMRAFTAKHKQALCDTRCFAREVVCGSKVPGKDFHVELRPTGFTRLDAHLLSAPPHPPLRPTSGLPTPLPDACQTR